MFSLVMNHPLVDGNKRLALTATWVFLDLNGYLLNASQTEYVDLALDVASGQRDRQFIARWLRRHAVKKAQQ
jgi:death-on-curing protein